ncbi:hypothetical protein GWK91_09410 [Virgibacillus sp. MSP4-1]|nr:toprim domain-containing protein [Virgibacillus sp. MSP4-1]QHS24513.1 hypothetical protein GWK91_09410 [Virgibacillus sp. MSP4-1]
MIEVEKVIIVEGRSDYKKVKKIINEPLQILYTNGTISMGRLEALVDEHFLNDKEVYILVDADDPGRKLRNQLRQELSHAIHLYVDRSFREVETTPNHELASVLASANLKVHTDFLKGYGYHAGN